MPSTDRKASDVTPTQAAHAAAVLMCIWANESGWGANEWNYNGCGMHCGSGDAECTEWPGDAADPRLAAYRDLAAAMRAFWRLVSHLSLGHLSVVGGEKAAEALREVLRLYDCRDSTETRAAIRALLGVTSKPGAARVPAATGPGARTGGFCRGLDVTLTFDDQVWTTGGLFVLASVLDRFLALHATVNSFVRTRAVLRGRSESAASWPPRAGSHVLL